jgi:hypothetical protein
MVYGFIEIGGLASMKGWTLIWLGALAWAPVCAGCQYIPGSTEYAEEKAKEAAAALLNDPTSPLFESVRTGKDGETVCGRINGKNSMGAYVGYSNFYAVPINGSRYVASIEPPFDDARYKALNQVCSQSSRAALSLAKVDPTASAEAGKTMLTSCDEAHQYGKQLRARLDFDEKWIRACDETWTDEDIKKRAMEELPPPPAPE